MADSFEQAGQKAKGLRNVITAAVGGLRGVFSEQRTEDEEREIELKKALETWTKEIQFAESFVRDWHVEADKAVAAYRGESPHIGITSAGKLNLFHANVDTLLSIMYAKLPKVEADRRFADPGDDVARVASEMITRILQNDMNDPEDRLAGVLRQALQDRLLAGYGGGRVRYCMEEGPDPAALRPEDAPEDWQPPSVKTDEWCDVEYIHWRDVLWSPCRSYSELRWVAFRAYMTKAEVTARFGEDIAGIVPYATRGPRLDPGENSTSEITAYQDQAQAEVWEIWDKLGRRVLWYVRGCAKFLDVKEDPTELAAFFPDAQPMMANLTTTKFMPRPDYEFARTLYEEIDELESRIVHLTRACRVSGVYPAKATEIKDMLAPGNENKLIPVENWAMFSDRGGLKGQIDYYPIKEVAETLQILVIQQQQRIQQLYQVTGMSDIIRGQASTGGVTATEQRIKAQFASTRMQSFQDVFANFAADLLNRKVELIRKFYDPQRIIELSNVMNTPDAEFAPQAVALIKDERAFNCRVIVQSETMAQIDYESLKTERTEFLGGVSQYIGAMGPVVQQMPGAGPFLLELLKFTLAGMKSANQMEGIIDRAVSAMQAAEKAKAEAPPEPTPEEKAAQIETEGKIKVETVKAQAKGQADAQKAQVEMQTLQQEHALEMQKMNQEMEMQREEHALKMKELEAKIAVMFAQLDFKRQESQIKLEGEQMKQELAAEAQERDIEAQSEQHEMALEHQSESHEQDMEFRKQDGGDDD